MHTATPMRLETLTPYHHLSLAIPGGAASLSAYVADRSVAYGLAGALGGLSASVALPDKDYARDLGHLPWISAVFEAKEPRLMRPQGRRLTLEHEGGAQKWMQDATGTGNLKTWYFIQEVPPGVVYHGAVFGADPFALAEQAADQSVDSIVFRIGRHRGGLVRATRGGATDVRLNLHTGFTAGCDVNADTRLRVELSTLWDLAMSQNIPIDEAAEIAGAWLFSAHARAA